jgi:ABC-type polysaccharide/polyol phosphate export permease
MSEAVAVLRAAWFMARTALLRRYLHSIGGMLWSLLSPLSTILIYWLAFTHFIRVAVDGYFVWLVSGLIPWLFMQAAINSGMNAILVRESIVHATTANKLSFVLSDVTVEFLHLCIALGLLVAVVSVTIHPPEWTILALPIVAFPIVAATYGLAVALAYVAVRLRDTAYLVGIFLGLMFWLTPILYHWSTVPEPFRFFVQYNPFSLLLAPIQILIHAGEIASFRLLAVAYAVAAVCVALGVWAYRKLDRETIYYF